MTARPLALRRTDLLWIPLCVLVLFLSLYYPYVAVFPDLGFQLDPGSWRVIQAAPCPAGAPCLRIGDQVLALDDLTFEEFQRDRSIEITRPLADGKATARVLRDGAERILQVRVPDSGSRNAYLHLLRAIFPLMFWLMGMGTILFLRPRDERWLVLILFSFATAIWFAAGLASLRNAWGGAVVLHVAIWFFLPLAIHLHTLLPNTFPAYGRWRLLGPLYALSAAFLVADNLNLLLPYAAALAFVCAVVVSLTLLVLRMFRRNPPGIRLANRVMLYGVVLGFGPFVLFYLILPQVFIRFDIDPTPLTPWALVIVAATFPILPLSYVYAIYKHHLGALEFRANRLLGVYSFSSLYITLYVVILFLVSSRSGPIDERSLAATLATSLVFVASAPFLRAQFQTFVDRQIFGIKHTPEEVVEIVSSRIPTAFDRSVLSQVVVGEILPTLLIRQSALYLFENSHVETLYEQGLPEGEPELSAEELRSQRQRSRRYLGAEGQPAEPRSWVRLIIPLEIKNVTIGYWLLGRRDPDDFYPASDIHLLSTVANQIAPMVENIRLYERAQQEIAQRKLAEQEIRRSEERFRNLFEATLEGIAIVRNGVILEVNDALLTIFGYTPAELLGRHLTDIVPQGEATLGGVPREEAGIRSDGSRVDIEVAGKKYVFQGEDVTVVAVRDIARRKRNEAENRMLQRQLLHSQKMEAIGRLSAGVAHDFNNCLLAIFGYSDLLLATYPDDEFLTRNLTGIKDAGQKAAALTRQLLTFTRRQPMESKVMNLNEVIAGLEKMLQRLVGEDVALETDLHPGLAKVKIDPGQMEQAIINLVVNARHAMPTGGVLTIRTAPLALPPGAIAPHADVPEGSYVVLTVTDTGMGMDAETQSRIFEPFFTTKKMGEGTGLGLATVYGIAKQSRGHIFVDSAPGRGAAFTIYLPVSGERSQAAGTMTGTMADTGSETILLVEDEDEVRSVLRQTLAGRGYEVLAAASGEQALEIAASHHGPIHLLLTDVIMPQMKGTELAARILLGRPQTRVLYMSGYNEEPFAEGDGAPLCLQKPFSNQVLTSMVRAVLDAEPSGAGALAPAPPGPPPPPTERPRGRSPA